jgi:hypothetical protein
VIVRPLPAASLYKIEHCFPWRMPARGARRGGLAREKRHADARSGTMGTLPSGRMSTVTHGTIVAGMGCRQ